MNIFFTCSTYKLEENFSKYQELVNFIYSTGNKIQYYWIADALESIRNRTEENAEEHYQKKVLSIQKANALIVEGTIKSFTVGHQITIAINKSIPVLVLIDINNKKINSKSYLEGIKSEWITIQGYKNSAEANQYISQFVNLYGNKKKKIRFHLVISQKENNFLIKLMKNEQKTKTEIIRSLIKEKMIRSG